MANAYTNTALDPLAALQRWIKYTQSEIWSIKNELRLWKDGTASVRQIQRSQLDVLQRQLRENEQKLGEALDAISALFDTQCAMQNLIANLLIDLESLRGQTQTVNSNDQIPPTQPCPIELSD